MVVPEAKYGQTYMPELSKFEVDPLKLQLSMILWGHIQHLK